MISQDDKAPRWLLLIHQIPPKPDYFRVKVRRRLQAIGAVPLKNTVYALPNTAQTMEDFQWLRRLVEDEGGEATLCIASFIEGLTDSDVEQMFRSQADAEYADIVQSIEALGQEASETDVRRARKILAEVVGRDFFGALGKRDAEEAIVRANEWAVTPSRPRPRSGGSMPLGATWVTREDVFVDRIASAWLIKRFIDPKAKFKFVSAKGYPAQSEELRYDMFEGEYTHEGDDCTFEVLVRRFALSDPALAIIAEVVHDIDCKDNKFGREETIGVASLITGLTLTHVSDRDRIDASLPLLDSLYATLSHQIP